MEEIKYDKKDIDEVTFLIRECYDFHEEEEYGELIETLSEIERILVNKRR